MALPLMPRATAVWLVDNTTLTFDQIAQFCGMHPLEVQAVADGEVAAGIQGADPIANGQITRAEITRCENDPQAAPRISSSELPEVRSKPKGAKYTPVSRRQDRPDAIAWLIKHHPELTDTQIAKLIGTTKPTIQSLRNRSHWNIQNIKPQNPVMLQLCSEADLEKAVAIAREKAGTVHRPPEVEEAAPEETASYPVGGPEPDAASVFGDSPDAEPAPEPEPIDADSLFKGMPRREDSDTE